MKTLNNIIAMILSYLEQIKSIIYLIIYNGIGFNQFNINLFNVTRYSLLYCTYFKM